MMQVNINYIKFFTYDLYTILVYSVIHTKLDNYVMIYFVIVTDNIASPNSTLIP